VLIGLPEVFFPSNDPQVPWHMKPTNILPPQRDYVVYDVGFASGARHGNGYLVELAYLSFLLPSQPMRGGLAMFPASGFSICLYPYAVFGFPPGLI